jgi:preprotein translocase subunit SecA
MFVSWLSNRMFTRFDAKDFRGMSYAEAVNLAKDIAEHQAETQIHDALEENLPEDDDPADWNWQALASFANRQWNLNLRDRDLKKEGRDHVAELLLELSRKSIEQVDLSEGEPFLNPDFGARSISAWVRAKLQIDLPVADIQGETESIVQKVLQLAREAYNQREAAYPVLASLTRFSRRASDGHARLDRQGLASWAKVRFQCEALEDEIKNMQRDQVFARLLELSQQRQAKARELTSELSSRLNAIYGPDPKEESARQRETIGQLQSLIQWSGQQFHLSSDIGDLEREPGKRVQTILLNALDDTFHPEMRRMERALLLQMVDGAWKDHLLAMDHLRSSVGLVGYAQVDPKVEYKREGMKLFEKMWNGIRERTTELVFRMEQLDDGFVGATWVETAATHAAAPSTGDIAQQQQAAIDSSQNGHERLDPIRKSGQRIGRNDPCPCGSGKKYKNCCMRSHAT